MGQPVTLTVGAGSVQASAVETLNGVPQSTLNGPLAYSVDQAAILSVDPVIGTCTPLSAGTATVTVTDAVGNLTDSVVVTVLAAAPPPPTQNNGIILTIPPQTAVAAALHAAKKS
jgi:hypothetical protein